MTVRTACYLPLGAYSLRHMRPARRISMVLLLFWLQSDNCVNFEKKFSSAGHILNSYYKSVRTSTWKISRIASEYPNGLWCKEIIDVRL